MLRANLTFSLQKALWAAHTYVWDATVKIGFITRAPT
jgi:hypothetical protein